MSADEDTELRDLVAQSLESNGVLGKIRAQLRASIFLALEEQESVQNKTPFLNQSLKKFTGTKEGCLIVGLIREFLTFFSLEFTQAVFDPEVGVSNVQYESRTDLAREFNIIESDESSRMPLIAEVIRRGADISRSRTRSSTETVNNNNYPQDMQVQHIAEAKEKFEQYDKDKSGTIEKDELRDLFCDVFPNFNRNMLDRYVNDEFRASDKDFSNTIDFHEFLDMYKRLFVLCKSSISRDVSNITLNSPRRMQDVPKVFKAKKAYGCRVKFRFQENDSKKTSVGEIVNGDTGATKSTKPASIPVKDTSDNDEDSFFDDPLPSSDKSKSIQSKGKEDKKEVQFNDTTTTSRGRGGEQASLAGLPSLGQKKPGDDDDFRDIDQKLAGLGMDIDNDLEYDDDFESSNLSPLGITPRSARSDHNIKSIEEEIEEDIEELSAAEDFLKSDHSGPDDLTTDRTISPTDQTSGAFDYMEDVMSP